jgi:hypothetical protein
MRIKITGKATGMLEQQEYEREGQPKIDKFHDLNGELFIQLKPVQYLNHQ